MLDPHRDLRFACSRVLASWAWNDFSLAIASSADCGPRNPALRAAAIRFRGQLVQTPAFASSRLTHSRDESEFPRRWIAVCLPRRRPTRRCRNCYTASDQHRHLGNDLASRRLAIPAVRSGRGFRPFESVMFGSSTLYCLLLLQTATSSSPRSGMPPHLKLTKPNGCFAMRLLALNAQSHDLRGIQPNTCSTGMLGFVNERRSILN
jgi:hypothetical protein